MRGAALKPKRPDLKGAVPNIAATIAGDGFEAVVVRLDVEREATTAAAAVLSNDELERANRLVFQRDRDRFIVARAGLRHLLSKRIGLTPETIRFEYGAHGKPSLASGTGLDDLRFNVSHSHDVAVYAFTRGKDVGVDVEAVREIRDKDDIAAHCFSAYENRAYRALRADERSQAGRTGTDYPGRREGRERLRMVALQLFAGARIRKCDRFSTQECCGVELITWKSW